MPESTKPPKADRQSGRKIILNYLNGPESLRNDLQMEPSERGTGDRLYDLLPEVGREPDPYDNIAEFGKNLLMSYYSDPSSLAPMPMLIPTKSNLASKFLPEMQNVRIPSREWFPGPELDPTNTLAYKYFATRYPRLAKLLPVIPSARVTEPRYVWPREKGDIPFGVIPAAPESTTSPVRDMAILQRMQLNRKRGAHEAREAAQSGGVAERGYQKFLEMIAEVFGPNASGKILDSLR